MFNQDWTPPFPPHGGPCEPNDYQGPLVDISGPLWPTPVCIIPDGYWPAAAIDLIRNLMRDLLDSGEFSPETSVSVANLLDELDGQDDTVWGLPW